MASKGVPSAIHLLTQAILVLELETTIPLMFPHTIIRGGAAQSVGRCGHPPYRDARAATVIGHIIRLTPSGESTQLGVELEVSPRR